MTKKIEFGLLFHQGVNLDEAVKELAKFYKDVVTHSVLAIGCSRRIECESSQDVYERLSNTKLVEKTCEYTDKFSGQKKQHKYLTNDKKPEVDKNLAQYFAGIDGINHDHESDELDQKLMDELKKYKKWGGERWNDHR